MPHRILLPKVDENKSCINPVKELTYFYIYFSSHFASSAFNRYPYNIFIILILLIHQILRFILNVYIMYIRMDLTILVLCCFWCNIQIELIPAHKVHLQNIIFHLSLGFFSLACSFNISLFYINNKMVTLLEKKRERKKSNGRARTKKKGGI